MLSRFLFILAGLSAVLPVLSFIVGALLALAIPGCKVDEGAGGHGCLVFGMDISNTVAFLELGGFVSIFLGIPVAIGLFITAAIAARFKQ